MKRTATICFIPLVLALTAAVLVRLSWSEEEIQVVGDLSKDEVASIHAAVLRKMHDPILPDFSVQSFRDAPGLILQRLESPKPKAWTIEVRTHEFIAVIVQPAATTPANPNAFYSVFRQTNGWRVEGEYAL